MDEAFEYPEDYLNEAVDQLRSEKKMPGEFILIPTEKIVEFIREVADLEGEIHESHQVDFPIDLPDDLLFDAFKLAHMRNITFNQYIEEALLALINDPVKVEALKKENESALAKKTKKKKKKK